MSAPGREPKSAKHCGKAIAFHGILVLARRDSVSHSHVHWEAERTMFASKVGTRSVA
jgi:hypothetical protein